MEWDRYQAVVRWQRVHLKSTDNLLYRPGALLYGTSIQAIPVVKTS
jgi:hypothetical protein